MSDSSLALDLGTSQDLQIDVSNKEWMLNTVDEIIQQALDQKDVTIALRAGKRILSVIKLGGLGLAKLVYGIYSHWDEFGLDADSFNEVVYAEMGQSKQTIDRYIRVWALYAEKCVPEQYVEQIQQLNIRDQIPIANALKQGYEISDKQWKELANAPTAYSIGRIVQEEVRGKEPRSSALILNLDDGGTLYATKGGKRFEVGYFYIDNEEEIVQQAIERIIKNAWIMR